jgi:phage gp29-like protein
VVVDIEEAEDLVAGSQIVKNLTDAGVPLVASEIRERFGFREPQEGDEVVGGAPAPQEPPQTPPGAAKNARQAQGCPVHSSNAKEAGIPRDAIDGLADAMLADWQQVSGDIDQVLEAAAQGATDLEDLRGRLVAAVNGYDDTQLRALLTKKRTATRLAGDVGADI